MSRSGAVTFKGTPMTLVGEPVQSGQQAPDFTAPLFRCERLHKFGSADLAGKPTLISVVPSLDTGVCQIQTKKFNEKVAGLAEKINAVTVSLDLPFAQNRFCGAENIKSLRTVSDYQDRSFGRNWGMLIDELKVPGPRDVRARQERQSGLLPIGEGSHPRAELRRGPGGSAEAIVKARAARIARLEFAPEPRTLVSVRYRYSPLRPNSS